MRYSNLDAYLDAYRAQKGDISVVPIPLVADMFERTSAAVSAMLRKGKLEECVIGKNRFVTVRSLLNAKKEELADVESVTKYLVGLARKGIDKVFYEPVMTKIGLSWMIPAHRGKIGEILGEVSRRSHADHGVMLSVLVHRKKTRGVTKPSDQFFDLAKRLNYKWDDEHEFVAKQTKKVLKIYGGT